MTNLVLTELYTVRGETILVSPEDYRRLAKYQWRINGGYAVRQIYAGGGRANRRFKYQRLHDLVLPSQPEMVRDHINGNRVDNRRENLRYATLSQNSQNARNRSKSNAGFRGVHFDRKRSKFLATIRYDGRSRHIGYFDTAEDAAIARDAVAREAHGEFAVLNFPEDTPTSKAKRAALRARGWNVEIHET